MLACEEAFIFRLTDRCEVDAALSGSRASFGQYPLMWFHDRREVLQIDHIITVLIKSFEDGIVECIIMDIMAFGLGY